MNGVYAMKPERNITEAFSPVQGIDLASLRVECVYCDAAGEPAKRRTVSMLSLLASRRRGRARRLFADPQG